MNLPEHHIFVCQNERDATDPRGCCSARGSAGVIEALKTLVKEEGLKGKVRPNRAGCLDQCEYGVTVVVYPAGIWYSHVTPADVPELLDATLAGKPLARLLHPKMKEKI